MTQMMSLMPDWCLAVEIVNLRHEASNPFGTVTIDTWLDTLHCNRTALSFGRLQKCVLLEYMGRSERSSHVQWSCDLKQRSKLLIS